MWFILAVPESLINRLIFRDFAILAHERNDFVAIIGALMRRGYRAKSETTKNGVKLLRF